MTCDKCNSDVKESSIYCNRCGKKLKPSKIDDWPNVLIDIGGQKVNANPLTWQYSKHIGTEAFRAGDYYEAIEYFETAITFEHDSMDEVSNLYNELAISIANIADYKKALTYIELSISANPNNAIALANRAGIKMKLDDFNGAISDYRLLIDKNKMEPRMWHSLGIAHENQKQLEEAKLAYLKAISLGYHNATKDLNDVITKIDNLKNKN